MGIAAVPAIWWLAATFRRRRRRRRASKALLLARFVVMDQRLMNAKNALQQDINAVRLMIVADRLEGLVEDALDRGWLVTAHQDGVTFSSTRKSDVTIAYHDLTWRHVSVELARTDRHAWDPDWTPNSSQRSEEHVGGGREVHVAANDDHRPIVQPDAAYVRLSHPDIMAAMVCAREAGWEPAGNKDRNLLFRQGNRLIAIDAFGSPEDIVVRLMYE